ncbi:MAG TPA: polysaccharide biosynthesis C-terminal domain-containing protein [Candidatus Mediterraneibacter stercoripullorum]|nr:polysaccharide biosynthesis C-terminal domain-containing protein [Candidatus Mediterraneibacter stercoripullorum]
MEAFLMNKNKSFLKTVCNLAVPVALQSMLQASFSIVDQIMIGQLGSVSVAAVGLSGKFSSIFSVMVSAVSAVAGIMIAQYIGQNNRTEVRRSFYINLGLAAVLAAAFTIVCAAVPEQVMRLYSSDEHTIHTAADYLFIISGTFLPMSGATLLAALFRCMEKARFPLYASIIAALLNTVLNYVLIFGKCGVAPMGARGAAAATLISQIVNFLIMFFILRKHDIYLRKATFAEHCQSDKPTPAAKSSPAFKSAPTAALTAQNKQAAFNWRQYAAMLLPVLICEFMWSLGENVYAAIYGRLGTESTAAMTLINPVQSLVIGALCGLSQAAGVIIGKKLGNREYDEAYAASKKLILYGFAGSCILSLLVIAGSRYYVEIYQVGETVKHLTTQILFAYAFVSPFKVQNMIIGGGIIRSGGKTKYVLAIDLIGTWVFGVPLGLFSAFFLHLSIPYVYFILSLEECIRFAISIFVLRRKKWMQKIE